MKLNRVMRVFLSALLLVVTFTVGQRFSGSAAAQSRQKWEYQVVKVDRIDGGGAKGVFQIQGVSKLGEDGWEVVTMNDSWCLLKRGK